MDECVLKLRRRLRLDVHLDISEGPCPVITHQTTQRGPNLLLACSACAAFATPLDSLRIAAGRTAAQLLGAVTKATVTAVAAIDRFQGFVADQTRSEASDEEWW